MIGKALLNLDEATGIPALYVLQLKPLINQQDKVDVDLESLDRQSCFIYSDKAMGNGRFDDIRDILWVDPALFASRSRNCPFAGMTLPGRVLLTVCAGHVTWIDPGWSGAAALGH